MQPPHKIPAYQGFSSSMCGTRGFQYRVAQNLKGPYLYRSLSAKEPYNWWLFCGERLATSGILYIFATLQHVYAGYIYCLRITHIAHTHMQIRADTHTDKYTHKPAQSHMHKHIRNHTHTHTITHTGVEPAQSHVNQNVGWTRRESDVCRCCPWCADLNTSICIHVYISWVYSIGIEIHEFIYFNPIYPFQIHFQSPFV